jgi:4-amino-4-deoxy-L-arabinose transferase-like glycosyltransferase
MPTNTDNPSFPHEWITAKTIRTISGAALCCWLITLFFDLICFTSINNQQLHTLLVFIVSALSSIGLAINKVFSTRSANRKALWLLVIPNAMLIYIHALGFQVASKELAVRANAIEREKKETPAVAGTGVAQFPDLLGTQ